MLRLIRGPSAIFPAQTAKKASEIPSCHKGALSVTLKRGGCVERKEHVMDSTARYEIERLIKLQKNKEKRKNKKRPAIMKKRKAEKRRRKKDLEYAMSPYTRLYRFFRKK